MPFTDEKRYPGLFRLRGGLRSRPRTELPRPEARVPNRKVIPKIPPFAAKAGLSINMPQMSKTSAKARENLGWGGQKFAGNMTTDQFVTLAGGLAQAIAPNTPQGRVGGVLSQFGQQEMLRRHGMTETLRKEGLEREKFHTRSLLDVGKEERGYKQKTGEAEILAGAKKLEAGKTQTRHEEKETSLESRFTRREQRLKDQYGKGKGETGLTPSAQLTQLKLDAWKAYSAGTATPSQKELIKTDTGHTIEDVVDFLNGREYADLSELDKAVVDRMLSSDTGLELTTEEIPAERSWWGDTGDPNIPATTRQKLVPRAGLRPQKTDTTTSGKLRSKKVTGMTKKQAVEILKEKGYATTPENIAKFMEQN